VDSQEPVNVQNKKKIPAADFEIPINKNEPFLLSSAEIKEDYAARYKASDALRDQDQSEFDDLFKRIIKYIDSFSIV
jgi:hypothetical protein